MPHGWREVFLIPKEGLGCTSAPTPVTLPMKGRSGTMPTPFPLPPSLPSGPDYMGAEGPQEKDSWSLPDCRANASWHAQELQGEGGQRNPGVGRVQARDGGLRPGHNRGSPFTPSDPEAPLASPNSLTLQSLQTPAGLISPRQGPEPRTYRITGFQHCTEPQQPPMCSAETLRPRETPVHTVGPNEV